MALEVGAVVEGRVTGITKFGAFVALPEGKSGLVHISEVANAFVSDVHDHVQMGQTVKVRILSISPEGKINLSIKKAMDPPPAGPRPASGGARPFHSPRPQQRPRPQSSSYVPAAPVQESSDASFEDKLKQFMQDSDSKISGLYADRKTSRRRGRG